MVVRVSMPMSLGMAVSVGMSVRMACTVPVSERMPMVVVILSVRVCKPRPVIGQQPSRDTVIAVRRPVQRLVIRRHHRRPQRRLLKQRLLLPLRIPLKVDTNSRYFIQPQLRKT